MIYPDEAVRKSVVSLLSAANIQVFDSEADVGASAPYVLLLTQQNLPFNVKNGYGFTHLLTVSAVSTGIVNTGKAESEALLNDMLALLMPDKPSQPAMIILESPFRCWMVKARDAKDLVFTGDTESVYQKIVTLELTIELHS